MRSVAIVALLLSPSVALACGSDPAPPPAAPGGDTSGPAAPAATEEKMPAKPENIYQQSNIRISDEIRRACGIDEADAFFAFDSARLREQDQRVLGKLAECFSTGPLKGREMRLVGHADPRGDEEYNMLLGERRAENVKKYIAKKGLAEDKMSITSRGEMDAEGTDEAGWSKDRRVDIVLAD
jgi:peptidoglycan-associated lipoprotein